jgi:hypothetical protein
MPESFGCFSFGGPLSLPRGVRVLIRILTRYIGVRQATDQELASHGNVNPGGALVYLFLLFPSRSKAP